MPLRPLLDTIKVEIVTHVTRQSDNFRLFRHEVYQAYETFPVLRKLLRVKGSCAILKQNDLLLPRVVAAIEEKAGIATAVGS